MLAEEQAALGRLVETLADHDDALLEKVLEDIKPTPEELYRDMRKDLLAGAVIEVLVGAAEHANGVRRLWKALRHDTPTQRKPRTQGGSTRAERPRAQVFRTAYAGHTGKLSYARIWSGTITDGAQLGGTRLGGIYRYVNGELTKSRKRDRATSSRSAGWMACRPARPSRPAANPKPCRSRSPTPPVYAMAITTTDRKDDVKLSGALHKLAEEDPLAVHYPGTAKPCCTARAKCICKPRSNIWPRDYSLKLATHKPAIAYKETIRKPVHEHGRLKRQTGGHGQFADVKIDIAPRARGEGFQFVDKVVGGAVPRNFIPAVGEAAEEAHPKGPFGYPVVDVSVTLVDGGFHSVDSSDMAFKTATQIAMKEGLAKADPVLLEPVDHVTISVPNDYTAAGATPADRTARSDPGLRRTPGLAWLGRRGGAGAGGRTARPDHRTAVADAWAWARIRKRFDHLAETRAGEVKHP